VSLLLSRTTPFLLLGKQPGIEINSKKVLPKTTGPLLLHRIYSNRFVVKARQSRYSEEALILLFALTTPCCRTCWTLIRWYVPSIFDSPNNNCISQTSGTISWPTAQPLRSSSCAWRPKIESEMMFFLNILTLILYWEERAKMNEN
jgi:hypothetical protein